MPPNQPSETAMEAALQVFKGVERMSDQDALRYAKGKAAVEIQAAYAPFVKAVQSLLFDIPQFCMLLPQKEFELSEQHLRKSVMALSDALAHATPKGGTNDAS